MISRRALPLLFLLWVLATAPAQARVLVLVHGWSADADTWLHSGVVHVLETRGWADAGVVAAAPEGVRLFAGRGGAGVDRAYRVNLPAAAPMLVQAAHLVADIRFLQARHPGETMTLVGHSAGGVVARLAIIGPNPPHVDQLITIAAPHLGTVRAVQGLDAVDSKPFFCPGPGIDFLKSMFGGATYDYLSYSRPALIDLSPAQPGSLIGWLNQQPHPEIDYDAIVRYSPGYAGDELVPAFSQDMNQVPALRGRARVHVSAAGHALNAADGALIADLIAKAD